MNCKPIVFIILFIVTIAGLGCISHLDNSHKNNTHNESVDSIGNIEGKWKQSELVLRLVLNHIDKVPDLRKEQDPVKPYPYSEEEVVYENKEAGIKLAGTLTLPRSGGPFPAVLLITGSGPQNRDEEIVGHRPFLVLSDYLTRQGIAVLRVDEQQGLYKKRNARA
jgi:hypothetical protein